MLLTNEINEKMELAELLKKLFKDDNIENAFYFELSKILTELDSAEITPEYTSFYETNLINEDTEIKKIKFNNKIIHQSKLLNYFIDKKDVSKMEKETDDILKSILKTKNILLPQMMKYY